MRDPDDDYHESVLALRSDLQVVLEQSGDQERADMAGQAFTHHTPAIAAELLSDIDQACQLACRMILQQLRDGELDSAHTSARQLAEIDERSDHSFRLPPQWVSRARQPLFSMTSDTESQANPPSPPPPSLPPPPTAEDASPGEHGSMWNLGWLVAGGLGVVMFVRSLVLANETYGTLIVADLIDASISGVFTTLFVGGIISLIGRVFSRR